MTKLFPEQFLKELKESICFMLDLTEEEFDKMAEDAAKKYE